VNPDRLRDLFGAYVTLETGVLKVGTRAYPILDDVIILLDEVAYSPAVRARLGLAEAPRGADPARGIQFTFGEEWKQFSRNLPEYEAEFRRYFDLVDLASLADKRVCDLGCGMGRWSRFLAPRCRELVLVDFSDAIFIARENLRDHPNALFFMADIRQLPFREDFADLIVSLGVLHHLPADALGEVRHLRRFAPQCLIYLYYALDNRPAFFRGLLAGVTWVRRALVPVRSRFVRALVTRLIAGLVYRPFVGLGAALRPFGVSRFVPLYEIYHARSWEGICQDVYDRFFTGIEQRVSRTQIEGLRDTYADVRISGDLPYWHFLCRR
jgi:SAM-dependent methyltransferase